MSETASFVDPVFLARFGLSRASAVDYFLHPLNPFRSPNHMCNEVLAMQGISIGMLMQQGAHIGEPPLPPAAAEEEYNRSLKRMTGEQYELLPPSEPELYVQASPLYTIRHVLRTSPNSVKVLGIYYVVEGVIYKSPSVRSLMKTNVARTLDGLSGASSALATCARYLPSVGYTWVFEREDEDDEERHDGDSGKKDDGKHRMEPIDLLKLTKSRKRRKVVDTRRPGERTAAEEEGIRASEAIDRILVRLKKKQDKQEKQQQQQKPAATAAAAAKKRPPP